MAITKEITQDKIEIVGQWKNIQIRELVVIKEDGTEISRSFHRRTITCESDVSSESEEIIHINLFLSVSSSNENSESDLFI